MSQNRKRGALKPAKQFNKRGPRKEARVSILINPSQHFMPSRFRTTLRFNASGTMNNAALAYANVRLEPTYAYDIDPVLGSTSMPGFSELAACYRTYRVNWFRLTTYFVNKEAFPVQVYLCPVNFDPAANTSAYQKLLSNPDCVITTLGPLTGNSAAHLTKHVSVASFAGIARTLADDYTSASTSGTAPVNNIWIATGVNSDVVLVNGVYTTQVLEINLDFYELQSPST